MNSVTNSVLRKREERSRAVQTIKRKGAFNPIQVDFFFFFKNLALFSSSVLLHLCLLEVGQPESAHGWGNTHTHKTTEQTPNTWAQPTCHMCMTFCRGCHSDKYWQEKNFWGSSLVGLRLLTKRNFCHVIKVTMGDLWKCASPAEALKKDKRHSAVCPPLSCCKADLGLCLHCAVLYSKRA